MNKSKHWLKHFEPALYFTLILWVIKSAEELFSLDFHLLTIQPRETLGLLGIIFAPLLHGSWDHLMANSLPMLLLGGLLSYGYPASKWKTLLVVWLISGIGVWLFARPSYHLGASGLTTGFFYFLFIASIIRRDKVSIALMFIAVFMYGGILLGILPWDPKISFEAHFFGAIGGALSAIIFRDQDPKPERKVYEWEGVEDSDEDEEYWKADYLEKEP
ncbi:rhomboid family intramembrane serine protease [Aliikangiella coralliicola]|uniref:Rhomboid family intramembrane serine protease n=1 Tax=Aliikangiella coralliicola TaxID=2592383 RepID=A0A545UJC6_9GAMM|nr:rhomboid family intramembrane serine protease [Aliikangiella coralliicola]TQV89565.1 rhomboid family intramembrane serine protease [Aliikangiella coralliicola]